MAGDLKIEVPPSKPLILFDGECDFCRRWITRWRDATRGRVSFIAYQDPAVAEFVLVLTQERCETAVQLIESDGEVYGGAEAICRMLGLYGRRPWMRWLYSVLGPVMEWGYGVVARRRGWFSFLDRVLVGGEPERARHLWVRWVFLRLLALVYLVAIGSFWVQVPGLVGERGIMPIGARMDLVREQVESRQIGLDRYRLLPTLSWLEGSEAFVGIQCGVGVVLSVLVLVGVAPGLCLFLLWVIYLSLCSIGDVFMGFQWDNLLLETGFLAIFLAPWGWLPRLGGERSPSVVVVWLLRWLLFRLMLASGWVKLLSGDPLWREWTALAVHYQTQPLPTWIGWYLHQLPLWFHQGSVLLMFGIELVLPLLIFMPRRVRVVPCVGVAGLMLLIAATGNYCFFNLLTLLLCLVLLDDSMLLSWVPRGLRQRLVSMEPKTGATEEGQGGGSRSWAGVTAGVAVGLVLVTGVQTARMFWPGFSVPGVDGVARWVAPLRSANRYGLFAVMTPERPEIVIEGSEDGETWRAYGFKYKPGALDRRPGFVAPHQPRLDWQMWFAALGDYRSNPWFMNFCQRLLEGSPEVLELLGDNPFPESPPRQIRARVYNYEFTSWGERRQSGEWWKREFRREYVPVLSLRR